VTRGLLTIAAGLACAACAATPVGEDADEAAGAPLALQETRELELRYLEFDVQGFSRTLKLADLRAVPRPILDDIWLMDLDLTGFVDNALSQIAAMPPESLPDAAARNLQRLITMTPNNVVLDGTSMEPLVDLSRSIGIAPQDAVNDLMQAEDPNAPVIPTSIAAAVLLEDLIATHPNAQFRDGPNGEVIPIAPHAMPIRLGDVVDNFARLNERFGPVLLPDGRTHPGIVKAASGFAVVDDQFAMTVLVNANALPYKGVDLDRAEVASVNSLGSQIDHVFPLERPDWLTVTGMVAVPTIGSVTMEIRESPEYFPPGTAREPLPYGDSRLWQTEPWFIERMVGDMAFTQASRMRTDCVVYDVASGAEVFRACMDDSKWVTFETFNNVGMPPAPKYMWDIVTEMAQVRLHDQGLPEGTANAQLTLTNLPLGVESATLVEQIRTNIAAHPAALRELAEATNQTTRGEADFYYYRPQGLDQDWLYFITESDIPRTDSGERARPYTYAHPGFYADAALTQPVSAPTPVDGDTTHLKFEVKPGQVFYAQDAAGGIYRIQAREKPGRQRIRLAVTRIS
jgi:hypothetical protein